ncbi:MAG: VWA domain-containing protein, partial [Oscillospiraceae bacterium]|nr:VWA domain-containing protein [Oscillospiraceae bacterium]
MKKHATELVFILDRSGSMSGLEADTIGGFNSMIEKQKQESGEAMVTTILFDSKVETIHDRTDIQKIAPMTNKDYYVRGTTALLDAVGSAIQHISHVHTIMGEDNVPEHTMFVITTDGMENASKEFTMATVKRLIE